MSQQERSNIIHISSTLWFAISAVYMLGVSLLQSGKSWWLIISVSGYSFVIVFLMISLYLFAIFRGVSRSQKTQAEHPFTTSAYYMFFYNVSPFLGALVGSLAAVESPRIGQYFLLTAAGSLWVTFLIWIIVDPLCDLAEMMLPSSRAHRIRRLSETKAKRRTERLAREYLLAQVQAEEQFQEKQWKNALEPYAEKLSYLMSEENSHNEICETEAIEIGVKAWHLGGIDCMRQLHSMAGQKFWERHLKAKVIDQISIWWDGIGTWRSCIESRDVPVLEQIEC
ncbi:hypothetical protein ACFL3G_10590 [Planctomycetota bacterium]